MNSVSPVASRRRFLLAGLLAFVPCTLAQGGARQVVIGVVYYRTPLAELAGPVPESPTARAFVEGLQERGWVHGRNARIVWRSGIEHMRGVEGAVEELVRMPVDILVVGGNDIAQESARRAPSIPVVMASSDFPVENGIVASYSRPGGNITGLTNWVGRSLNAKRIALLKEAAPRLTRLAVLAHPVPAGTKRIFGDETQGAADALGVTLLHVGVNRFDALEAAFEKAVAGGANGIFVADYPFAFVRANQLRIVELAAKHRLPAIHSASTASDSGALLTYGFDIAENFRRAAHIVDKILRGAKAGEIPIEDPARLELVVNLKAARAIGLSLPPSILLQANRVIQ